MVKIEDTYQEEEFQVGESSQATIATPISDEIAQKIFKTMEEQSDALKKMGIRLTELEEAKLKKPPCVEVLDEEEGEYWDERDKPDYERNKKIEKLMAKTIAMREKMGKMQLAFHKARRMDDCLYNMEGISFKTPIALPPKFKISNAEKFGVTGDPSTSLWT